MGILTRSTVSRDFRGWIYVLIFSLTGFLAHAKTFILPHCTDGGGFSMQFSINNPGSERLVGLISFYDSNGNPEALPFVDGDRTTLAVVMNPNTTEIFQTLGTSDPPKSGYAVIETNTEKFAGVATFKNISGFETSILPVSVAPKFAIFIERSSTVETGIALVRLTDKKIDITLYNADGMTGGFTSHEFLGRKDARTAVELFNYIPESYRGMLIPKSAIDLLMSRLITAGSVFQRKNFTLRKSTNAIYYISGKPPAFSPTGGESSAVSFGDCALG